jgi:hypothetical protein
MVMGSIPASAKTSKSCTGPAMSIGNMGAIALA